MNLGIAEVDLDSCVQCGLCLPHCPTWRVTGEEDHSPRGRIATMRLLQDGRIDLDEAAVESFESCVQCRGCEPACPSGVPFGSMIHSARVTLGSTAAHRPPWWQKLGYRSLSHPLLVRTAVLLGALGGRLGFLPERVGAGHWPVRLRSLVVPRVEMDDREQVWVFRGCVMDALQRHVHQATIDALVRSGFEVRLADRHDGCCGALASHAGLDSIAGDQLARLETRFPGDARIVVDSAGCGAHLKDRGESLSERVVDVLELLAEDLTRLPEPAPRWVRPLVAVSDPCHLRHVQGLGGVTRQVLDRYADLIDLDDDGLCCGAGGAFAVLRPDEAAAIRDRKVASVERSAVEHVASANPGCAMHLAAAGITVSHPVEIMARAIRGDVEGGSHGG